MEHHEAWLATPLGTVRVAWGERGISSLQLDPGHPVDEDRGDLPDGVAQALSSLDGSALTLDLGGLADFHRAVLQATRGIPFGETRSYGWVAQQVGNPGAVRAVGTALGRNPVPLLLPCHRVVRADGSPGHYVFGDQAKQLLLRLEQDGAQTTRAGA